jgi:hypothetical protein
MDSKENNKEQVIIICKLVFVEIINVFFVKEIEDN